MSTGTKRLIRRLGTLGNTSVPVIHLIALGILLGRQGSDTTCVVPSVRVPLFGVLPDQWVHLGDAGAGEDKVAFGDDVGCVFGMIRRGEGVGHGDVGDDLDEEMTSQHGEPWTQFHRHTFRIMEWIGACNRRVSRIT